MPNILVFDNKFNVESLSALSSINTHLKFYQYNEHYSFFDNFDLVKPNLILVNNLYYKYDIMSDIGCPIENYKTNKIIVNKLTSISKNKNPMPALIINNVTALPKKDIKYNSFYAKIYSLAQHIEPIHNQYLGYIKSCETLHYIINTHKTILSDTSIIFDICKYMQTDYGYFKNRGTIQINNETESDILTNITLYEKYISNFF